MIATALLLATAMSFTTIQQGPLSGVDAERHVVVRTEAEWNALWREHQANREEPRVDFSRSMVIALFMGSRPTAGYTIQVTRVEPSDHGITVFYRQAAPDPGAMVAQVLTAPFHIIQLDRAPGDVRFERDRAPLR
jgi:hypothetical protein